MSYVYLMELAAMVDEAPEYAHLAELLQEDKMTSCQVDGEQDAEHGIDLLMSATFEDGSVFKVLSPNICAPRDFYKGDIDATTEHWMAVMEID